MGYFSCNEEIAVATCHPQNSTIKKEIRRFSFTELQSATNNFSQDTFLGKGSHGDVYKAVLDDGKLTAAVKKTTATSEVEILSHVRSPRLVNLVGHCLGDDEKQKKQLIVVEYMPNGTLYDLLHVSNKPPGFRRRVRFALQVAKAVLYLHSANPPVIHRDIKSSNVLIDSNFNARLGDFGLALRGNVEDVYSKCTPPAGTLGYLDPCYLAPGDLSTKIDVFSLGILLLELITGRNAIDMNHSPSYVLDWAAPKIRGGDYIDICDPRIPLPEDEVAVRQLSVLAARCVKSTAEKRPMISEVVDCLEVVYGRVRSSILNKLGRGVGQCMKVSSQSVQYEPLDDGAEIVKVLSRRSKKLSGVSFVELEHGEGSSSGSSHVGRSNSVGSIHEIEIRPLDHHHFGGVRGRVGVAVKMPTVRLNKSRSMGMLHSRPRNAENNRFMVQIMRNSIVGELDESKLLINLEEK